MNVLIIGFGSIGKRHFSILSKMKKIKNIKICTNTYISSTLKIDLDSKKIKEFNPDYIIISSQTSDHIKHLSFINKILNDKIILVEKPIFHSKNIKLISNKNNKIFIGYNLRFDPMILYLKKFFNNKNLKKLLNVTAYCGSYLPNWRNNINYKSNYSSSKKRGGGVEFDLSHEFDYIDWIFGKFKTIKKIKSKISSLEINSNDFLLLIGKFSKNKYLNISLNYFSKINLRFLIIETNDYTLKVDLIKREIHQMKLGSKKSSLKKFIITKDYTYRKMHSSIINSDYKYLCTFNNAIRVLSYT